jgi:glycosyltransferase involved in cell wall biosynthesis
MKIGILIYRMSSIGGIERITTEKIKAFIEIYGYDVVLITKDKGNLPFIYDVNKKCKYYNLDIQVKSHGGLISYVKNIPQGFKFFVKLKKIVENEKVDILFTTLVGLDSLIVPFVKFKTPKILEIHRSGYAINRKAWVFKKPIIQKYAKVVLLNKDEIDYFGLNNTLVIPNFIDYVDDSLVKEKKNIIISAGRIGLEKQFDHLVDIWSVISSKHPEWELHIYGDGSKYVIETLNKMIKEKGIKENFKLFSGTTEIESKMREAKIFVLVSKSEGFSMVLLEAMAAELPIVSYDSPHGPKNIITNGKDGFLVALNDKHAFAEKLSHLIENSKIREEFVVNQKIKLKFFSKKNVMKQWNDLIQGVLSK